MYHVCCRSGGTQAGIARVYGSSLSEVAHGCARNRRRLPSNHVPAKPAYDEPRKNRAAER